MNPEARKIRKDEVGSSRKLSELPMRTNFATHQASTNQEARKVGKENQSGVSAFSTAIRKHARNPGARRCIADPLSICTRRPWGLYTRTIGRSYASHQSRFPPGTARCVPSLRRSYFRPIFQVHKRPSEARVF